MAEAPQKLSQDQLSSLKERAKKDLYFFAKGILGYDWLTPHIHLPICRMLEDRTNRRVKIVLPRGWLKSTICTIAYPLWEAIRNPDVRVLLCQNTHTNACKKLAEIRSQVEKNPVFRALWPELLPDRSCTWTNEAVQLRRKKTHPEATFEAAGTRTKIVSRHYDIIIEDDTVAPDLDELGEENIAPTKDDIDQAIGFHRLVPPLLTDPTTGRILIVGTRWFERDLMSWTAEKEPYYITHTRACRELEDGSPSAKGEITYPERFSEEVLVELEAAMGLYMFSCLYLNLPIRTGDMLFREEWFNFYDTFPEKVITYTTVDLASDPNDTKGEPDWNVILTCGKDLITGRIYVLDYKRLRCSPSEVIDALFEQVRTFKPVRVGIESVGYQRTLLYWVRERQRQQGLFFVIDPLTHGRKSKEERIRGLQPVFANGALYLRTWMQDLRSELLSFPLGAHDDVADALSMQLPMWRMTRSKKEQTVAEASKNPFTLEGAITSIRERNRKKVSLVYDTLRSPLEW